MDDSSRSACSTSAPGDLDAARWIDLSSHTDDRGTLTVVEGGRDIPFDIKRIYFVHDVVRERGGHAHRDTHQVVTAASGRCELVLSDGTRERRFVLDDVRRGVYIGPMLFIRTIDFAPGTVLVSMASTHYDTSRSLRSWDDYLGALR
jgi:hypothetical protein